MIYCFFQSQNPDQDFHITAVVNLRKELAANGFSDKVSGINAKDDRTIYWLSRYTYETVQKKELDLVFTQLRSEAALTVSKLFAFPQLSAEKVDEFFKKILGSFIPEVSPAYGEICESVARIVDVRMPSYDIIGKYVDALYSQLKSPVFKNHFNGLMVLSRACFKRMTSNELGVEQRDKKWIEFIFAKNSEVALDCSSDIVASIISHSGNVALKQEVIEKVITKLKEKRGLFINLNFVLKILNTLGFGLRDFAESILTILFEHFSAKVFSGRETYTALLILSELMKKFSEISEKYIKNYLQLFRTEYSDFANSPTDLSMDLDIDDEMGESPDDVDDAEEELEDERLDDEGLSRIQMANLVVQMVRIWQSQNILVLNETVGILGNAMMSDCPQVQVPIIENFFNLFLFVKDISLAYKAKYTERIISLVPLVVPRVFRLIKAYPRESAIEQKITSGCFKLLTEIAAIKDGIFDPYVERFASLILDEFESKTSLPYRFEFIHELVKRSTKEVLLESDSILNIGLNVLSFGQGPEIIKLFNDIASLFLNVDDDIVKQFEDILVECVTGDDCNSGIMDCVAENLALLRNVKNASPEWFAQILGELPKSVFGRAKGFFDSGKTEMIQSSCHALQEIVVTLKTSEVVKEAIASIISLCSGSSTSITSAALFALGVICENCDISPYADSVYGVIKKTFVDEVSIDSVTSLMRIVSALSNVNSCFISNTNAFELIVKCLTFANEKGVLGKEFKKMVRKLPNSNIDSLLRLFLSREEHLFHVGAAILCEKLPDNAVDKIVIEICKNVETKHETISALSKLGEICKRKGAFNKTVFKAVLSSFMDSPKGSNGLHDPEFTNAVCKCIGKLVAGAFEKLCNDVFGNEYICNEGVGIDVAMSMILNMKTEEIAKNIDTIDEIVLTFANRDSQHVRDFTSRSLAILAVNKPDVAIPLIKKSIENSNPLRRGTGLDALTIALDGIPQEIIAQNYLDFYQIALEEMEYEYSEDDLTVSGGLSVLNGIEKSIVVRRAAAALLSKLVANSLFVSASIDRYDLVQKILKVVTPEENAYYNVISRKYTGEVELADDKLKEVRAIGYQILTKLFIDGFDLIPETSQKASVGSVGRHESLLVMLPGLCLGTASAAAVLEAISYQVTVNPDVVMQFEHENVPGTSTPIFKYLYITQLHDSVLTTPVYKLMAHLVKAGVKGSECDDGLHAMVGLIQKNPANWAKFSKYLE